MSRVALSKTQSLVIVIFLIALAIGGGVWGIVSDKSATAQTVTNSQHQLTQISYHGQTGVNALALLEKYATVQTKHYSFGDFVTSIDGVIGNGPKYWTFYVNGKEASVGAGAYTTKTSDNIMWRLQ